MIISAHGPNSAGTKCSSYTHGSAWGGLVGERPLRLEAGDILLVPHGSPYVMSSSPTTCTATQTDLEEGVEFFREMATGKLPFVVEQGRGRKRTRMICGFLGCDVQPFSPVLAALPPLVRLRGPADGSRDRLHQLIDLTVAEEKNPGPGSHCVLLRLSELMFVEVLRRCLAELSLDQRLPRCSTRTRNAAGAAGSPLAGAFRSHDRLEPDRDFREIGLRPDDSFDEEALGVVGIDFE
ncbi:MAG: cupin domain-containing protein [Myxococcota bacterium]